MNPTTKKENRKIYIIMKQVIIQQLIKININKNEKFIKVENKV